MITVYDVTAEYGLIRTYLDQDGAHIHARHAQQFCRLPDEWIQVQERDTDKLSHQSIYVKGDVIGYQFSRLTNGGATIRRTVRELHRDDELTGIVTVMRRKVRVVYSPVLAYSVTRCDSAVQWVATELLGWVD